MHYDQGGAMRTTPTKVLEMFLDLPTLGTAVESAALMAAHRAATETKCKKPRNRAQLDLGESR